MLTYRDVQDKQLGQETRTKDEATAQLDESIAQEESMVDSQVPTEQENVNVQLTSDAQKVIDQMDQIHDQGGDPMGIYNQLPAMLQQKVSELLSPQEGQEQIPQDEPMQPMERGANQGVPQQQNGNITEQARQLATF